MVYKQEGWLEHLVEAVPIAARKNHTSMYTIALEGWRRGLKLKFYNHDQDNKLQIRYSLSDKNKTHYFNGSSGDKVSKEAFEICEDKSMTNHYLLNAEVPIPIGNKFGVDATNSEIVNFGKEIKFPLVIKPTNGKAGKGVVANIQSEVELRNALHYVREQLGFDEIILEQYVEGEEVRVYVLGDRVLGAANRRPANVVGDGISTINKLVKEKNEFRKYIPHLYFRPIKIDREVKQSIQSLGYTIDSIPKEGERIFLRKISNVSKGGEPIDVTRKLSDLQKNIAINATKAIPGLAHCGVDMIINEDKSSALVLELNTRPGIGSHLFPIEGIATDIPKEIIDFYFPDTKGIDTSSNVYFDFQSIHTSLNAGSTIEIEVAPIISKKIIAKRYVIIGDIELIGYHQWLQKKVFERELNGFVKRIDDKNIEIVIAGTDNDELVKFKEIINQGRIEVRIDSEEYWNHPVKLGFDLMDGYDSMSDGELETEFKRVDNEVKSIQKDRDRLKHKIKLMSQSKTWKYTSSIRNLFKKSR